jgi:hypothetical protein
MFSTRFRFIFIVLFILSGVLVPIAELPVPVSLFFFAAAVFLTVGHFKNGPMLSILFTLKKGDIAKAEKTLLTIKKPEWLSKQYQAYFHFAWAVIATFKQDLDLAKMHSETALGLGKLQEQEQAILIYNLARVAFERKEVEEAKTYITKAEQISIKDLHLKQRFEELNKLLQQHN